MIGVAVAVSVIELCLFLRLLAWAGVDAFDDVHVPVS